MAASAITGQAPRRYGEIGRGADPLVYLSRFTTRESDVYANIAGYVGDRELGRDLLIIPSPWITSNQL